MYTASSSSMSSMACLRIMLKRMLNRLGARTQPCFTPLTMGKGSERLLFNLTWRCCSSCIWTIILKNFGGKPRCSKMIGSNGDKEYIKFIVNGVNLATLSIVEINPDLKSWYLSIYHLPASHV